MGGFNEGESSEHGNRNSNFALIVVLFILLVIVGASFMMN